MSSDTKIQIWKQFTTKLVFSFRARWLCHPIQRYKFESNSQHVGYRCLWYASCVIRYKDTNLKAIHNTICVISYIVIAVSSDTKIQIWKQFTTAVLSLLTTRSLCHPIQRYKFESNSQRINALYHCCTRCVIRYKDTNLKAIHNYVAFIAHCLAAVSSDTKIQIWKQFTTHIVIPLGVL